MVRTNKRNRMSLLLTISAQNNGGVYPPKPVLQFIQITPALVTLQLQGYSVGTTFQASQDPTFATGTQSNADGIFINLGTGIWYFRGSAINTQYSNRETQLLTATPLRTLAITADAGVSQVSITHDVVVGDATDIAHVQIWRRANQTGIYAMLTTFTPAQVINVGIKPYIDTTSIVNGTRYDYYFVAIPASINNTATQSNIDDATPQAITPQLSVPTGFAAVQQDNTAALSNTTLKCTWAAVANANQYTLSYTKNGIAQTAIVGSALTQYITGLAVNDVIALSLIAQDTTANYLPSNAAPLNRTLQDVLTTNNITPEFYNAEAYYKPLDGRREIWNYKSPESFLKGIMVDGTDVYIPYVSMAADIAAATAAYNAYTAAEVTALRFTDYPRITYTPFSQMSIDDKQLLSDALLAGENYTMITVPTSTFTNDDLHKEFCGRENHRNEALGAFIDEYIPYGISARYSKVCLVDSATKIFVDFEYNGGNVDAPQIQENGKGYIYFDNTTALNQLFAAANTLADDKTILFAPLTYSAKVITAYVAPLLNSVNANLAYNWLLKTSGTRSRIKYGIEDYFYLQLNESGSVKKYPLTNSTLLATNYDKVLFNITTSSSTKRFVSHNIQFVPAHGILSAAVPVKNKLIQGTNLNLVAFIRPQNGVEQDAIALGTGITQEKFAISMGDVSGGAYTGSGTSLMHDVSKISYQFHHDFRYAGAWALGQVGGGNKGGNYTMADAGTFDFGDQSEWAPGSNTFNMRFVANHNTLGSHIQANAHLPTHSLQAATEGNFLSSHTAGGNYRHLCYHIDKAILFADFIGNARYKGYWQLFYRNYAQALSNTIAELTTTNAQRAFLCANIPVKTQPDGQTPKHYVISRGIILKEGNGQHNSLGTPRPISVLNTAENYIDVTYIASGAASSVPRLTTGLKIMFTGPSAPTTPFTVNSVVKGTGSLYRFVLDEDMSAIDGGDVTHIIEIPTVPTIGMPFADAISTHINWCVALQKYVNDVTEEDLVYINEDDNKQPVEFQILDQFTCAAWVKVTDSTGFAKGDIVTDTVTGATGVVLRIDNYLTAHKIVIGENRIWTGTEWERDANYAAFTGTQITNGAVTETILSASTFEPSQIHTVVKKQVPNFSGSDYGVNGWETWVDVQDTTIFATANGVFTAVPVLINGTIAANASFKSATPNRIRFEIFDDRHKIPAGATITRVDNAASTTALTESDLLDQSGNYYVHNGAGGSQSVGLVMSAIPSQNIFQTVNLQGYYYSDVKVSPALPDDVNEDLDHQPIFDIQMLNSECEYLLTGDYYNGVHTYLELNKYGGTALTFFNNNGGTQANGSRMVRDYGYGTSGTNNNLTGFLTPSTWPRDSAGTLGHGRYSVAENSFDYRYCDFRNSYLRTNGSSVTQLYNLGDGGEDVYSLMYYMKVLNLVGCVNYTIGESFGGGSGAKSPQKHMDKMRRIYAKYLADNGVAYVPPYAADGLPVRPLMHVHRSNISTASITNEGANVVKSDSATNAPQYPQTLIELQTELNDNFLFE